MIIISSPNLKTWHIFLTVSGGHFITPKTRCTIVHLDLICIRLHKAIQKKKSQWQALHYPSLFYSFHLVKSVVSHFLSTSLTHSYSTKSPRGLRKIKICRVFLNGTFSEARRYRLCRRGARACGLWARARTQLCLTWALTLVKPAAHLGEFTCSLQAGSMWKSVFATPWKIAVWFQEEPFFFVYALRYRVKENCTGRETRSLLSSI
jgi:hypothetical protein